MSQSMTDEDDGSFTALERGVIGDDILVEEVLQDDTQLLDGDEAGLAKAIPESPVRTLPVRQQVCGFGDAEVIEVERLHQVDAMRPRTGGGGHLPAFLAREGVQAEFRHQIRVMGPRLGVDADGDHMRDERSCYRWRAGHRIVACTEDLSEYDHFGFVGVEGRQSLQAFLGRGRRGRK